MHTLIFTLNLAYVHNLVISLLSEKNIDLDVFYDEKLSNKFEKSKLAIMNRRHKLCLFIFWWMQLSLIYYLLIKTHKWVQMGYNEPT
jgi:hypothetical protein